MLNVNDLKPGITFEYEENIYSVIDAQHSKSGRGQAHVKSKIKNLRTGAIITKTFTGGEKVKPAFIEQKDVQFLYDDGSHIVFMDNETFEQIELPLSDNKYVLDFLTEGSIIKVVKFENEILGVTLPTNVKLKVVFVEHAVKGDSATGASKKARLETGLEVSVPMFIKEGEIITISTADKKYIGRS